MDLNLKESGRVGFFKRFDAELYEGRRVLEVGRASGNLFTQTTQLQVAFPAGKFHQGFFSAAQCIHQFQTLTANSRFDVGATFLRKREQ